MITIFGALGIPDTDYSYVQTIGQGIVYDGVQQVLGDHNADVEAMIAFFVERTTWDFAIKYKLPGNGRMQRRGRQSRTGEVKTAGEWTVQFPLEDFGASIAIDRITLAYMTLPALDNQLKTVVKQDINTIRFEILRAIFNNTARPFVDEVRGSLTIQPLANGDAVLYPPQLGSETNATANMFFGVPTPMLTFTDANNPIPILVNALESHFGTPTGGSKIVILVNNAQTASVQNLAGFDPVPNRFVSYGENVSLALESMFPEGMPPGRVIGECDSALIVEWRWIPAGYIAAFHLEAPKPLIKRVDPPEVGLTPGLQMVVEQEDAPFYEYEWCNRYGFGTGNRLNGAIIDLTATTANTYTIPVAYQ